MDVRNVTPFLDTGDGNKRKQLFQIVYDPALAANNPGLECTVFFDSYNSSSLNNVYVAVKTQDQLNPIETYYPFQENKNVQVLSITLKSNGRIFNIVSGGVSYWQ